MAVVTVAVVTVAVGPACRELTIACLVLWPLPSGLLGPSSPAGQYVCARPCAKAKSQHNRRWQWQQDMSEHGWRVCVAPCWHGRVLQDPVTQSYPKRSSHWAGSTFRSAWCSIQLYNDGGDGNRQVSTARRVSALQGGPCASQGRPCERRVLCRKEGRPAARPQSA